MTLHTARDLGQAIRNLRPDAAGVGITITDDWCRDQMHALDITRYEDVDDETLSRIADAVDELATETGDDITDEQIEALRSEAAAAGDTVMVALCTVALTPYDAQVPESVTDEDWRALEALGVYPSLIAADDKARALCAAAIADARAQQD